MKLFWIGCTAIALLFVVICWDILPALLGLACLIIFVRGIWSWA